MQTERKELKSVFRIDVKELDTRKVKGFMVYNPGDKKINLIDFVEKLKKKVEEIK